MSNPSNLPQAAASAAAPSGGSASSPCCGEPLSEPTVERVNVRLQADQPVVPVPVYQEIYKRDKYIEVPQVEVRDTIIPKVYNQAAVHEVPRMDVAFQENPLELEATKEAEREVEVPVLVGYAPKFVPKWDLREVPRPVPKYEGEQEVIEVEVPQIEYKDVYVEKEVVVDVKEKVVPKVTEVAKEVEIMKYEWKERQQDVPVYKYVPKFDVELDCPPAMIVPYPELRIVKDPPQTSNPYRSPCGISCELSPPERGAGGVYLKQPGNTSWLASGAMHGSARPLQITAGAVLHSTVPAVQPRTELLSPPAEGSPQLSVSSGGVYQSAPQGFTSPGSFHGVSPEAAASPLHLPPGPIFPLPSPQVDTKGTPRSGGRPGAGSGSGTRKPEEGKTLWSWLFGKKEQTQPTTPTGGRPQSYTYPEGTPTDFTAHFQRQMQQSQASTDKLDAQSESARPSSSRSEAEQSDLEPTVTYRGAVSMPAEYGGELNPISFKLHAVEIHQFVPLPNVRVPEFVKALPDGLTLSGVSGLDRFFGPVPTGWADPDVTGIPAPMMSDILAGNIQATTTSPLINQLSSQFAKQESTTHEIDTDMFLQRGETVEEGAARNAAIDAAANAALASHVATGAWRQPVQAQLEEQTQREPHAE